MSGFDYKHFPRGLSASFPFSSKYVAESCIFPDSGSFACSGERIRLFYLIDSEKMYENLNPLFR